jgi:hypothetical protein
MPIPVLTTGASRAIIVIKASLYMLALRGASTDATL